MRADDAALVIAEEPIDTLAEHATLPIAFVVDRVYDVVGAGAGARLVERAVPPYLKDYDAVEPPALWPARFDLSRWGLVCARAAGARVGGAIAFDTPGHAVLWDLRVAPAARRQGVGSRLVAAVEDWARARGCRELRVETQNINVAACRFYQRAGFRLVSIDRGAYPDLPDEIQLLFAKELT
jgi:ribosomal protein S18 acetylase RimI-like enzyme